MTAFGADHEADGLQVWVGQGAVRLDATEGSADTIALLLERCRLGTPLTVRRRHSAAAGLSPINYKTAALNRETA